MGAGSHDATSYAATELTPEAMQELDALYRTTHEVRLRTSAE